jgi:hypothetical protein
MDATAKWIVIVFYVSYTSRRRISEVLDMKNTSMNTDMV